MSKGEETRKRIVKEAMREASRAGLEGLSIGGLAATLGMSKSGLFAHFGSKEELQLAVLEGARRRFERDVIGPALAAPGGLPRLRALFEHWLAWSADPRTPGGCLFTAAATELDDRPGAPRDFLAERQVALHQSVVRMANGARTRGMLRRDLDCELFAFELQGIVLAFSHYHRLLRDEAAALRASAAFDQLVAANTA
jgi:AcrR family transcriptional regulator